MITRPLLNAGDLAEWARGEGFQDIRPEGWHVSLARTQSRTTRPTLVGGEVVVVMAGNVGPVRQLGPFMAMMFDCDVLSRRHAQLLAAGSTWDHQVFRPHVTFAVAGARDRGFLGAYGGSLVFGPETLARF